MTIVGTMSKGSGGVLVIAAVVGGIALLLLAGLGMSVVFVPAVRVRVRVLLHKR